MSDAVSEGTLRQAALSSTGATALLWERSVESGEESESHAPNDRAFESNGPCHPEHDGKILPVNGLGEANLAQAIFTREKAYCGLATRK